MLSSGNSAAILTIALSVVAASVALLAIAVAFRQFRNTAYDSARHRIQLETMRRALESRLYNLNDQLVATEDRWKDVNHLLLSSQSAMPDQAQGPGRIKLNTFLRNAGLDEEDVQVEEDLVFVLTPFHPDFEHTYEVLASTCREIGLRCLRGDESYVAGDVFPHILRLIARARIVIANIDGRNPNVFYELGIAHAMSKVTIVVARNTGDVPFDLRTKKIILYSDDLELRERLKTELARTLLQSYHGDFHFSDVVATPSDISHTYLLSLSGSSDPVPIQLELLQRELEPYAVLRVRQVRQLGDRNLVVVESGRSVPFSVLRSAIDRSGLEVDSLSGPSSD